MRPRTKGLALCLACAMLLFGDPATSQQLDQATIQRITAHYLDAKKNFEGGNNGAALQSLSKIDSLNPGPPIPTAQNLKVKVLIAMKDWDQAQIELKRLYKLDLSEAILLESAAYQGKIEAGFESDRKAKEAAKLAYLAQEEKDFQRANDTPRTEPLKAFQEYEAYLKKYSNGRFVEEAKRGMALLAIDAKNEQQKLAAISARKDLRSELSSLTTRLNRSYNRERKANINGSEVGYWVHGTILIHGLPTEDSCRLDLTRQGMFFQYKSRGKLREERANNVNELDVLLTGSHVVAIGYLNKADPKSLYLRVYDITQDNAPLRKVNLLATHSYQKGGRYIPIENVQTVVDTFRFYGPRHETAGLLDAQLLKEVFKKGAEFCGFSVTFDGL